MRYCKKYSLKKGIKKNVKLLPFSDLKGYPFPLTLIVDNSPRHIIYNKYIHTTWAFCCYYLSRD